MKHIIELPDKYKAKMNDLLGEVYPEYERSFEKTAKSGLRINTRKIEKDKFIDLFPLELEPVPWIEDGYYYPKEEQPAKHPFYAAGLYYLQEPSAMTPASRLPIESGDRVLDLCAAPGGKSTQLASRLGETGMLFSNDISSSRAKGLLKNLELCGAANVVVASENPGKLERCYMEYFDKILVDAPCSGEGMFRRDPSMVRSWLEHGPEYYAAIQKELIVQAAHMLKPGGMLLYSTCTFAKEEDEEVIRHLLDTEQNFTLCPIDGYEGFSAGIGAGMENCVRIYPHKMEGEGHFLALLKKEGQAVSQDRRRQKGEALSKQITKELVTFLEDMGMSLELERVVCIQDNLYLLPRGFEIQKGIRYLRTGLLLGTVKKGRFEPSQALAMSLKRQHCSCVIYLEPQDERAVRYLKGETIALNPEDTKQKKGWVLICIDEYPLGWGKIVGGMLRNKYYPGWRWM